MVSLCKMSIGSVIKVRTRNTDYCIQILEDDQIKVQGGAYFSEPQEVYYCGAIKGTVILPKKILAGYGMEFICENGRIICTSNVEEINGT